MLFVSRLERDGKVWRNMGTMNKKMLGYGILAVIIVVAVIGFGAMTYKSTPTYTPVYTPTPAPTSNSTTGTPATPDSKSFTMAQIQTHKDASSCWTTINGNVYDLSSWIKAHPGGQDPILSICGLDGSALFNEQHGGQRRPESVLDGYIIGTLAK